MKKLYIILLFLITGIMAEAQTSVWNGNRKLWTHGEGTESSPYLIESADNLAFLSYMVNKGFETQNLYFLMTTDIDLNGSDDQPWIPIGMGNKWIDEDGCDRGNQSSIYGFSPNTSFRGHFDGGEHNIYNLYIDGGFMSGLFGMADLQCEIKNVHVKSGYIHDADYAGGIVGKCNSGVVISNCSNNADITGDQTGGIVGFGTNKVTRCFNSGQIKGNICAGGIAGSPHNEISECYNTGDITSYLGGGGILGSTQKNVNIVNCYNTGKVSGNGNGFGGIAGIVKKGVVKNCYNVGDVSNSQGSAGGVIGSSFNGTADNLYYLNTCGGDGIGVPLSAIEMRDAAFVDVLNNDTDAWGYDINNANDGYPVLESSVLSTSETTAQAMSVYPNPAKDNFTVEGTGRLTVINLLGQRIMEQDVENQTVITLPQGIYLLRLTNGHTSITKKIIVY